MFIAAMNVHPRDKYGTGVTSSSVETGSHRRDVCPLHRVTPIKYQSMRGIILSPGSPSHHVVNPGYGGYPVVTDSWQSRIGELLLQSYLAARFLSLDEGNATSDSITKSLSLYGIAVHEIEIHIIEKNFMGRDEVIIGTFVLDFQRGVGNKFARVYSQGLITAMIREAGDVVVKFTSPTYQFMVRLGENSSSQKNEPIEGGFVELQPIPRRTGQV